MCAFKAMSSPRMLPVALELLVLLPKLPASVVDAASSGFSPVLSSAASFGFSPVLPSKKG